jgi:hypothetical protein
MGVLRIGNTKSKNLADDISEKVPKSVQLQALVDTYPNGIMRGTQFEIGSLDGEKGKSLKISVDANRSDFMQGMDFSTHEGVGGITKIMMEGRGMTLQDVSEYFADYLGPDFRPRPPENPVNLNLNQESPKPQKMQIDINTPHDGEHVYESSEGEIICLVRRYISRSEDGEVLRGNDGKAKKEFRQFSGNSTFPKMPDTRPLYNIPGILEAERIIWVEGEKCADDLNSLGHTATCHLGGAGMLSVRSAPSYDFSPLQGKQVILWPDNDSAGVKVAKLVQDLATKAGATSVTMLTPPRGKPEKWDASDAISEGFDVNNFLNAPQHKTKQNISLRDESLLVSNMFVGSAPEQRFLIADTIPLGVPVVFAAAGDSGKGMMTLDLAMKVASGESMQSSFGGFVANHGNVVLMSAEDDKDELHRRIERLDPLNARSDYQHDLRVLPLPNLGGVFPMMQKVDNTYIMAPEFERLYEQILEIDNLALFVADPMASFVHADINADPAAGAAFMGMLAQLATETGATVMVNHHMAKIRDNDVITTPEQARNLIRGTSAIVDGVRSAFSVWQVDEKMGRQRCKDLGVTYTRNSVFDGAVVKSNGPANREIRHFIRNQSSGLLEDRSVDIKNLALSSTVMLRLEYMYQFIAMCEENGMAVTKGGGDDGAFEELRISSSTEPFILELKEVGASTIKNTITMLLNKGRIKTYKFTQTGKKAWLGTKDGPMSQGIYEARTARENL